MNTPASDRPQLLVTLLDWGMGHATRTLPLIEHAAACGWHVHVATKGTALAWLKRHLDPALPLTFHDKPGPEIKYAKRGNFLRIAGQMPAFVAHVERERTWTSNFVRTYDIDAIYSDNCYGTAVPGVPSILMSHQLQVPTPKILEGAARTMVARWAKAFDQLWVPDTEPGPQSLSGHLAAADVHPHTEYVGVLSRLAKHRQDNPPPIWHKVGMVSGLEPHRGLMEEALRGWMVDSDEPCLVIAGKPGGGVQVDGHITTWCDPNDAELASALQEARTVVCRSGYSSQLDLAALGARAILIPTPGQPEQEALGKLWASRFGFTCLTQKQLEAGDLPEHATGSLPDEPANVRAFDLLEQWLHTHQPAHA